MTYDKLLSSSIPNEVEIGRENTGIRAGTRRLETPIAAAAATAAARSSLDRPIFPTDDLRPASHI